MPIVVVLNVLLALYGFQLARQFWRLRRSFSQAADRLIVAEQVTHKVLHGAPEAIRRGQLNARQLRDRYQQLEPKLRQAQRALAIIGIGRSILRPGQRKSSTRMKR